VFTEDKKGRILLTMDIGNLEEVAPWLRSFGGDVEVLAPPDLTALIKT
jgi:predicted DNA-binding transcriptional regulator YafY